MNKSQMVKILTHPYGKFETLTTLSCYYNWLITTVPELLARFI